jgi:hypothetical protein
MQIAQGTGRRTTEANAYYYKLKENEESIRGIELMLHCIRQQIRKNEKIMARNYM